MQNRKYFGVIFLILLLLSLSLIFASKKGVVFNVFSPLQKVGSLFGGFFLDTTHKTKEDNASREREILEKLSRLSSIEAENNALKFQFENQDTKNLSLIAAKIVGAPGFIPGVSHPFYFIIDKGANNGIKKNQAVIFGNNVVGKIDFVNSDFSRVLPVYSEKFSEVSIIQSNDPAHQGTGLLKGQGEGNLILDNVLPSMKIEKGNILVTQGSFQEDNTGFPPGIILGRVTQVEDNKSAIFKKADAESLLNFDSLVNLFVVNGLK